MNEDEYGTAVLGCVEIARLVNMPAESFDAHRTISAIQDFLGVDWDAAVRVAMLCQEVCKGSVVIAVDAFAEKIKASLRCEATEGGP